MPGVGTVVGGALGGLIGGMFDSNEAPAAPQGEYRAIDPNVGIGQGSFGLTPQEIAQRNAIIAQRNATYGDPNQLRGTLDARRAELAQWEQEWRAANPATTHDANDPVENSRGAVTPQARREAEARAMNEDPRYAELRAAVNVAQGQYQSALAMEPQFDMSDPGRFAAMSAEAQGRGGVQLNRYGGVNTAAPDVYEMQRQNAPRQWDPGEAQRAQVFNAQSQSVDKTQIAADAGAADYAAYQQARAKNLEVMGAVQDRAMGRGGPSPAELQMKQGQDRAIAQQAALAASGGQMDSAIARRQAMLNTANIGQKTASDTSLLRANEQIAAQNTFGGMNSGQQSADLSARNQSFGQAQARAANDWTQNMGQAQFMSDQSFRNAQLNASQSQFNAGQMNQYNLGRAQTMAQQGQFGAQFGLEQERAMAQSYAQQRQFNSQFNNQQNQWNAQFGAQQELNQGQLTMQQRAMNDQYQSMLLGQYMNSRGMQQQNAFQNQNAYNQMAGINAGIGINNANIAGQSQRFNQQQQTGILTGLATGAMGYMTANGGGASAPAVANSGFNQSNPNKIDWGY
jgi:hypothetical protein